VSQLHKAYVGLTVAAENKTRILCSWREVSRRLGGVQIQGNLRRLADRRRSRSHRNREATET
jgi:hypothetical protein